MNSQLKPCDQIINVLSSWARIEANSSLLLALKTASLQVPWTESIKTSWGHQDGDKSQSNLIQMKAPMEFYWFAFSIECAVYFCVVLYSMLCGYN